MAMVYFAGHGVEIEKQNYLIPVDAKLESDSDVLFDTIPLDLISEAVSGATTLRMVLLDACRNNPFLGRIKSTGRAIGQGLSPFEPTGGTLVAYAAKGGTTALDGTGRNSPFMKGLLEHIEQPGLDIALMFRKVRDTVLAETGNRQEPFIYGSLPGREIYLVPPTQVASTQPLRRHSRGDRRSGEQRAGGVRLEPREGHDRTASSFRTSSIRSRAASTSRRRSQSSASCPTQPWSRPCLRRPRHRPRSKAAS